MSATLIIVLAVAAVLVLWGIKVQNQLVQSDELCNNALKQINVQQVSRYDALKALVKLTREYATYESETLEKVIAQRKITAAANPSVDDINANEAALQAMSAKLIAIAEQYPDLPRLRQARLPRRRTRQEGLSGHHLSDEATAPHRAGGPRRHFWRLCAVPPRH